MLSPDNQSWSRTFISTFEKSCCGGIAYTQDSQPGAWGFYPIFFIHVSYRFLLLYMYDFPFFFYHSLVRFRQHKYSVRFGKRWFHNVNHMLERIISPMCVFFHAFFYFFFQVTKLRHYNTVTGQLQWWSCSNINYDVRYEIVYLVYALKICTQLGPSVITSIPLNF